MRNWKVSVGKSARKWRCRWRGIYGTGQITFDYKTDAQKKADEKRREFQAQDAGIAAPTKPLQFITVGRAADEYLVYSKKEKSKRTYRNFDLPSVSSLTSSLKRETLLQNISPSDVQKWKHSLPESTTASMHFRGAQTFFNYSVKMKWISDSPAKGLTRPPEGDGGRPLTDAEMISLLGAAPEALYKTGIFSRNTLLRIEEITDHLVWERVFDLPGGGMIGRIPWQLRKTRNTNPDKLDCIFPINAEAKAVMGVRKTGRVFPWSKTTIQHQVVRIRRALGLSEDITFHCFRHTGASKYLEQGHMEDLLPKGANVWKDPRSLLRYVKPRQETLVVRFEAMKYAPIGPNWAPQRKSPVIP